MNRYAIAAITFCVVLTVMALLTAMSGVFNAMSGVFRYAARRRGAPGAAAGARQGADAELEPERIAVLAAAAQAVLQRPCRVHRVHLHRERRDDAWGRAGRMTVVDSHQVAPKR